MQVEDDTSPSRKGRKANIRVLSRGSQQQASEALTKPDSQIWVLKPQKRLTKQLVSTNKQLISFHLKEKLHSFPCAILWTIGYS